MHQNPEISALLERAQHPSLREIMPGLERMQALLNALGNPETKLPPVIHIAGTNGKGSTAAYLTAMLQRAGLRVHRYTSPHLVRFNERIMLADTEISDIILRDYLERVFTFSTAHPTTFFETTTAVAMLAFAEHPADVCILEVGLGGRLDATNVVDTPLLSIITPISMDHMDYLGDTLEQIAYEKAGIMKPEIPCIIAPQKPEALQKMKEIANTQHTPLKLYDVDWKLENSRYISPTFSAELKPSLLGAHQTQNASVALAACELISALKPEWKLDLNDCAQALSSAIWPARLQPIHTPHLYAGTLKNTPLWLDGGHNEDAAIMLAEWLKIKPAPRIIILGMLKDKDAKAFISQLQNWCEMIICIDQFTSSHTHAKEALAEIAAQCHIAAKTAANIDDAIDIAVNEKEKAMVLICGSLYLAGEVLKKSV